MELAGVVEVVVLVLMAIFEVRLVKDKSTQHEETRTATTLETEKTSRLSMKRYEQ